MAEFWIPNSHLEISEPPDVDDEDRLETSCGGRLLNVEAPFPVSVGRGGVYGVLVQSIGE